MSTDEKPDATREAAADARSDQRRTPPVLPPGGGLLLVDKPAGCTSHDVVGRIRGILRTRKVGHAGTLDPMATGLLVIAVERSTKLLGQLALTDKTYTATIRLGWATDTDDAEGTVSSVADPSVLTAVQDAAIGAGIRALTGDLQQVPSTVSAIKVDGRRSYERVRAGETVELAARPVTVSRFDQVGATRRDLTEIDLDVQVECTTGTYIRALARDLGAALGVGGHLTALRRTRVGPFDVSEAVQVGAPRSPIDEPLRSTVARAVLPAAAAAAATFRTRTADAAEQEDLSYGRDLPAIGITGTYAVLDAAGEHLLALLAERDGRARPVMVFAAR